MENRVAICIPSGDELKADFAMSLAGMVSVTKTKIGLCNAKSSIVAIGRNLLVGQAQEIKATHMLFLDSDMVFPVNTLDRLLSHKKDIVGCVYSRRVPPIFTMGSTRDGKTVHINSGLHSMAMIPTGCLLIKMSVFDKLDKPYFKGRIDDNGTIIGEDVEFCEQVIKAGYDIWCDVELSPQIGHIGQHIFFPGE